MALEVFLCKGANSVFAHNNNFKKQCEIFNQNAIRCIQYNDIGTTLVFSATNKEKIKICGSYSGGIVIMRIEDNTWVWCVTPH